MATERQIAANRLNAQKSTGPRTEEGKRKSCLNAYKHGILAQTILMEPEQFERREKFCKFIWDDLKPVGDLEEVLVRSIADTRFRINRIVAIEDNFFAYEAWAERGRAILKARETNTETQFDDIDRAMADVRGFLLNSKHFDRMTIYEARLQRKFQQELKQLRELQAARKAAEVQPQPEPEKAKAAAAAPVESIDAQPVESTTPNPEIGFHYSDTPQTPSDVAPAVLPPLPSPNEGRPEGRS